MAAEPLSPRPRKSRRFTAPPQRVSDSTLVGVFKMPHGAGRPAETPPPETPAPASAATHEGADTPATPGADEAPGNPGDKSRAAGAEAGAAATAPPAGTANPVLDQRAAEDDPRRWGDADDDLGDWLKSQRPPHWD